MLCSNQLSYVATEGSVTKRSRILASLIVYVKVGRVKGSVLLAAARRRATIPVWKYHVPLTGLAHSGQRSAKHHHQCAGKDEGCERFLLDGEAGIKA